MAQNSESSFDNFSIENTIEMKAGDSQLIDDFLSPETSTSSPEEVEKIVKTVEQTEDVKLSKPKVNEIPSDDEKDEKQQDIDLLSMIDESEEEEEEQEPIKKEESVKKDDEETPPSTQFAALSNDLLKLGVFTSEEDDESLSINTPEEFLERFTSEKKKGAIQMVNEFIGQFGEDYQQAFDAIYVKGVNPKEYFNTFNNISNFSELDLSVEENQISVLRQALTDQGFEQEDVETEIERLTNYGDLESVSAKHHKVLIKKEATKLKEIERQAQEKLQQKTAYKEQYITNVQTIIQDKLKTKQFDGIPINPKLASELHDFLLVDKYKTASGETLTDFDKTILELKRPENHELKVKVGLLLKMLEKDPTLSTIQKTGTTKQSNQLFGNLAKQVTTDTSYKNNNKPKSWFQ